MMANGRKVQEQEKVVKQKSSKSRAKKDAAPSPSDSNGKVVKKKRRNQARPKKDVHNPLDRTRQMEPQKERNVSQQNNKQPERNSTRSVPPQISQVTVKEPARVGQTRTRYISVFHQKFMHISSPALERTKKPGTDKVKDLRRYRSSLTPRKVRNVVPLQLSLRNINVPLPFTYDENQVTLRTSWRAPQGHAMEMAQHSHLSTPHGAQKIGLSALVSEIPPKQIKLPEKAGVNAGDAEPFNCLKEDLQMGIAEEVCESTEPRFITPKQVLLLDEWRSGSQKLRKSISVDRDQWLRLEISKQQDRRFAQKIAMRKKELKYFMRMEGVGRDVDDVANITPCKDAQSIANIPIREDVEESAQGYTKFLYRPGAAWRNLSSDSASLGSLGSRDTDLLRPTSCESGKSTTEIVCALSSASERRAAMRKELERRIGEDLLRKKVLFLQDKASSKYSQCRYW